jgi:predicted small metal-binding protein
MFVVGTPVTLRRSSFLLPDPTLHRHTTLLLRSVPFVIPADWGRRANQRHRIAHRSGCGFTASGETEEELLDEVVSHAVHDHGVPEVTPELAAKVKTAITRR